jgi:oligopeptide/dipeptide ABC transporter ATP-binding protein
MSQAFFEVQGLRVGTGSRTAPVFPVDGVSLTVQRGECLGVVGESGAGKTLTLRAASGLLPAGARLHHGSVLLDGRPYPSREGRAGRVGMVFQEPGASLNPLMRIGALIGEGLRVRGIRGRPAKREVISLLGEVGIEDPELRARSWPHELSGGQRQRVAIAMALAAGPSVLLCDEPTTALDTVVQERILELLDRLRLNRELAVVFVTHNIATIGRVSHRLAVMYAGRIVESGPTAAVLSRPQHPYTARLLASLPRLDGRPPPMGIAGDPPDPYNYPQGCRFHPRCTHALRDCTEAPYELAETIAGRRSACIHWERLQDELARECA